MSFLNARAAWPAAARTAPCAAAVRRGLCVVLAVLSFAAPAQAQRISAAILVQSSPLAGFQFHEGSKLWPRMRVGDALRLVRERDNRYDANAIRVEWQGRKLGYVPRADNADLARVMDRGQRPAARISRLREDKDPWRRIEFEVYLPL